MSHETTLLAIGDVLIDRPDPPTIFANVADVLRSADITFAQLEQMYSDKGCPGPIHASYSNPINISAFSHIGLDVAGLAGNHALDWGAEALLDTIRRLREAGIGVLGAGANLDEARQPLIFEKNGCKIAFLGYCCTGPEGYEATHSKPGFAPVRVWTLYKQLDYQPGTPPLVVTFPYKEDMDDMIADIRKVKTRADVVIVSIHWGIHFQPVSIPDYEFEVGHAAIDAGADLILGHHPHLLKGIEIYKGKVIFHSLGNFALELNPEWRGQKQVHTKEYMDKIGKKLYGFDPDPEYPTVPFHPDFKMTMIAKAIITDKKVKQISYLPCYINKKAEPEIQIGKTQFAEEVYKYVESISNAQKFKVQFKWKNSEVLIDGL